MAIKNIRVRGKGLTEEKVMSAGLINIRCGQATSDNAYAVVSFESTTNPDMLIMSSPYFVNIYADALKQVMETISNKAIYSINGIPPTEDGAFFITGSMCTDWKATGNEITITDHCTPCLSCDAVFRIKREFEFYRILLNALKDINIYDIPTVNSRISYLESERINVPEACTKLLADISQERLLDNIDISRYKLLFGDMLRQYVTTVHMWNYAVAFNNSSAVVSNTPEDPSGIMIQAKRGIAGCTGAGGKPTFVKCSVILDCAGAPGMSMFIPSPVTMFYPKKFGSIDNNLATVTEGNVKRTVTADFGAIAQPGTISLTLKALPFMAYILKNGAGQELFAKSKDLDALIADPGNGIIPTGSTGKFTERYEQLRVTADPISFSNPTINQYYEAKAFPSQSADRGSVTTTLTWHITITWTIEQDGVVKVEKEQYIFETPGLRSKVVNFFRASDFTVIQDDATI